MPSDGSERRNDPPTNCTCGQNPSGFVGTSFNDACRATTPLTHSIKVERTRFRLRLLATLGRSVLLDASFKRCAASGVGLGVPTPKSQARSGEVASPAN